jgi:HEAT repeat protein
MTRRKEGKPALTSWQESAGSAPKLRDVFRKAKFGNASDPQNKLKKEEKRIRDLIKGLNGDFIESRISADDLRMIGTPAIPALMEKLGQDDNAGIQVRELIGEIGVDDEQFRTLTTLLGDRSLGKETRSGAACVLSKMKDRETVELLTGYLGDPDIGKELAEHLAWEFGLAVFPQIAQAHEKNIIDKETVQLFMESLHVHEIAPGDIRTLLDHRRTSLERKWAAHALIELGEEPVPAVEKAHLGDTYELLSWCLGRLGLDAQQKMGIVDIINSLRGYKKPE